MCGCVTTCIFGGVFEWVDVGVFNMYTKDQWSRCSYDVAKLSYDSNEVHGQI